MKLAGRHHDAIKWGSYLPHWTQYHLPHLITQQSAVPCYYTPNIRPRIAYKRHFMTVSDPCSILALLWNSLELKGFILGWRTWGMKFYAQTGAVIMWSNKTWYHVQHCSDWRRIYLWVNSLTPGRFKVNFTWVIFKLILVVNGWNFKLKIQGQNHDQGQTWWSHLRPEIQSICLLFVSWQLDHFCWDIANSIFDLENSRSRSRQKSPKI